jgi:predicted dinucleotide-utilizing enzyme
MSKIKLGIIGFGSVGKFFNQRIMQDELFSKAFSLDFVWNRSSLTQEDRALLDPHLTRYYSGCSLMDALTDFSSNGATLDLIAELAHPSIITNHGLAILEHANLYTASVTAFSSHQEFKRILNNARSLKRSIYIPVGAAWGVQDIQKYAATGKLKSLTVSMSFHADALKLNSPLKEKLSKYLNSANDSESITLYDGDIRKLADLAPNNVNTMMCLALAVQNANDVEIKGVLKAHKNDDAHITEIEVRGHDGFLVKTQRYNPAEKGAVTGSNTYDSFLSSLYNARGTMPGLHFC